MKVLFLLHKQTLNIPHKKQIWEYSLYAENKYMLGLQQNLIPIKIFKFANKINLINNRERFVNCSV